MPLPFILAGAAVAAVAAGAKKAYDGYQDSSEADDILDREKRRYEKVEKNFKEQEKSMEKSLDKLGQLQLAIGEDFSKFDTLAKSLLEKLSQHQETKDLQINIPKHQLDKIQGVAFSAIAYLGQIAGSAAVGAGAAYAVYGGVMALAAASTGTPIAALSGAAAYNATMAAIGGGSIAAGGFGMAGGAAILGGVVAAPIALVAGWAYANHAEKKLENAREYQVAVDKAVLCMKLAISHFQKTEFYVHKIYDELNRVYKIFGRYFQDLKNMDTLVRNGTDVTIIGEPIIRITQNGYALASILTDVITTPLFKAKKQDNGELVKDENDAVVFETDSNGMKIINKDEINDSLEKSKESSTKFDA
ncbi:chemotaxis protein [Gallibacterium anatis]|uniref:Chemotaxis protein n=1 Tax=Gallibacterium anatis TaxID=750 RepID=A0A1A7P974_9PAST|nr:chemotaxis protein [Gallibacterium anatis]OBW94900.1 chemotaxis protein [Gallibacterium anatis]OBW98608.1 chemotaxis protein [Gallibacterium anatis]UZD16815.1 chemotaxis protein [Gallibacterium anatis]